MKLKNIELFSITELTQYVEKFTDKLESSNNKINQLKQEVAKLGASIDSAIEKDILEETAQSKKELANVMARKENVTAQLNLELEKASKLKEIMEQGLHALIPVASDRLCNDLKVYIDTVERELYNHLHALKERQSELLLILQACHDLVNNELADFNEICNLANMPNYKRATGNDIFHLNMFMPNRAFAELGSPLLQLNFLPLIDDVLLRSRATANAIYNDNRADDMKQQLPPHKTLADVDIQKFLDEVKVDARDK